MRTPLMAGNWKLNKTIPETVDFVKGLKQTAAAAAGREVLVCPPFTALHAAAQAAVGSDVKIGAQDVYWETKGAFTGEVAPGMLTDAGCTHVIIGHSERRQFFGETNETVNRKMKAAFAAGLVPVVCVGETLAERESGRTMAVIDEQVKAGIAGLDAAQAARLVIAYEPVWAIGTGKTATPAQAQEVHAAIRSLYGTLYGNAAAQSVRILYGGSVKPDNVADLMRQPDIDGGLVGGASLDLDSFKKLVAY